MFDWSLLGFRALENSPEKVAELFEFERLRQRKSIGFFFGSGISFGITNGGWASLLQRLLHRSGIAAARFDFSNSNPDLLRNAYLDAAQECKAVLSSSFHHILVEELYKPADICDKALAEPSEVCELLRRARLWKGNVHVVTLNFDDFIESYLRLHCHHSLKIWSKTSLSNDDVDFLIEHIHGYLPRNGSFSQGLVFTRDEYEFREGPDDNQVLIRNTLFSYFNDRFTLVVGVGPSADAWQIPVRLLNQWKTMDNVSQPNGIWCVIGDENERGLENAKMLGFVPVRFESAQELGNFLNALIPM